MERLAVSKREFGEFGGVNAAVEVATTFTGAWGHNLRLVKCPKFENARNVRCKADSTDPTHLVGAVLKADTLPEIFAGKIGPQGGLDSSSPATCDNGLRSW